MSRLPLTTYCWSQPWKSDIQELFVYFTGVFEQLPYGRAAQQDKPACLKDRRFGRLPWNGKLGTSCHRDYIIKASATEQALRSDPRWELFSYFSRISLPIRHTVVRWEDICTFDDKLSETFSVSLFNHWLWFRCFARVNFMHFVDVESSLCW